MQKIGPNPPVYGAQVTTTVEYGSTVVYVRNLPILVVGNYKACVDEHCLNALLHLAHSQDDLRTYSDSATSRGGYEELNKTFCRLLREQLNITMKPGLSPNLGDERRLIFSTLPRLGDTSASSSVTPSSTPREDEPVVNVNTSASSSVTPSSDEEENFFTLEEWGLI